MILSEAVSAWRSDCGTILSPENLVPDGFITILCLLLWDHNVVVSPFLPHRNATVETVAPIFACWFLIYGCTDYIRLYLQSVLQEPLPTCSYPFSLGPDYFWVACYRSVFKSALGILFPPVPSTFRECSSFRHLGMCPIQDNWQPYMGNFLVNCKLLNVLFFSSLMSVAYTDCRDKWKCPVAHHKLLTTDT